MDREIGDAQYYKWTRKEILPLLPLKIDRVLEVGCGEGHTLDWIRSIRGCTWIAGIELGHEAAVYARKSLNECYEGDIEKIDIPIEKNSLDLILCLDVLEHLVDPWSVLDRLNGMLKPGGVIIASIPNIMHYSVTIPLIFKGAWEYADAGILDKSHLRFFVKKTAVALMESAGLNVEDVLYTLNRKEIEYFIVKILPWFLKRFFVFQYLIKAKNVDH